MEFKHHTDEVKPGSEKSFGVVFAIVFLLVALWPVLHQGSLRLWALAVSAVFILLAYTCPRALAPLNHLWFRFGLLLHRIISPVILLVMFCITILPIGLVMRLAGKDPLRLRFDPSATSYWIERTPPKQPDATMKNQF